MKRIMVTIFFLTVSLFAFGEHTEVPLSGWESTDETRWYQTTLDGVETWYCPDWTTPVTVGLQVSVPLDKTVVLVRLSGTTEYKHDGIQVRVQTGEDFVNITDPAVGGILSPAYNTGSMSSGPLVGQPAFSGTMPGQVKIDLTSCRIEPDGDGNIIIQVWFGSDTSVGKTGVWLLGAEYWHDGLEAPPSVNGWSDNSSIYVDWVAGSDPRISSTELWVDGSIVPEATSPTQINGLNNGSTHTVAVKNLSATEEAVKECNPSPLEPACTGIPPMTLLTLSKDSSYAKGSWISQTAEVPCWSGVSSVDSYKVYHSTSPNGPWGDPIASGESIQSFLDYESVLDNSLYFYKVVSTKAGVWEEILD